MIYEKGTEIAHLPNEPIRESGDPEYNPNPERKLDTHTLLEECRGMVTEAFDILKEDPLEYKGVLPVMSGDVEAGGEEAAKLWKVSASLAWGLRFLDHLEQGDDAGQAASASLTLGAIKNTLDQNPRLRFLVAYKFHESAWMKSSVHSAGDVEEIMQRMREDYDEGEEPDENLMGALDEKSKVPLVSLKEPSVGVREFVKNALLSGANEAESGEPNGVKFADVVNVYWQLYSRGVSEYHTNGVESADYPEFMGDTYLKVQDYLDIWQAFEELHNRTIVGPFTTVNPREAGYMMDAGMLQTLGDMGMEGDDQTRYEALMNLGTAFKAKFSK